MAKILVADDSITDLKFVHSVLEDTGHEIVTAMDGEDAESKAKTEGVQLIILDVIMPGLGGHAFDPVLRILAHAVGVPDVEVQSHPGRRKEDGRRRVGADQQHEAQPLSQEHERHGARPIDHVAHPTPDHSSEGVEDGEYADRLDEATKGAQPLRGKRAAAEDGLHHRLPLADGHQSGGGAKDERDPHQGSQRRIQRLNQVDIEIRERTCEFSQAHFDLYKTYTAGRHADGEMAHMDEDQYMGFVRSSWCDTVLLEFRQHGRLVAVAVTDVIPNGLSAVYTFFDPALSQRSLGVFAILSQIEHARQTGRRWLYLGYWIKDSPKMAYKTEYRPLQLFRENRWMPYPAG